MVPGPLCEKCKQRPGAPFRFHFGHVVSTSTRRGGVTSGYSKQETTTYAIDGQHTTELCTACLERAQRRQALGETLLAVLLGLFATGVVAGVAAPAISRPTHGQPIGDTFGFVVFVLFVVGVPLVIAIVLLVRVGKYVTSNAAGRAHLRAKQEVGEKLAIRVSSPGLRSEAARRGYGAASFKAWTPEQFRRLKQRR